MGRISGFAESLKFKGSVNNAIPLIDEYKLNPDGTYVKDNIGAKIKIPFDKNGNLLNDDGSIKKMADKIEDGDGGLSWIKSDDRNDIGISAFKRPKRQYFEFVKRDMEKYKSENEAKFKQAPNPVDENIMNLNDLKTHPWKTNDTILRIHNKLLFVCFGFIAVGAIILLIFMYLKEIRKMEFDNLNWAFAGAGAFCIGFFIAGFWATFVMWPSEFSRKNIMFGNRNDPYAEYNTRISRKIDLKQANKIVDASAKFLGVDEKSKNMMKNALSKGDEYRSQAQNVMRTATQLQKNPFLTGLSLI